ncbi:MAG TPA: hypothetical protein VH641_04455 [Streptosporangiaceae bacterium]|jgi:hypothetical protein
MHCDTLVEPACAAVSHLVTSATSVAAGGILSGLADAISAGVRWTVANTVTWWIRIPSPDLISEPAITQIQAWLLPVTVAVAIGAMIAAGARMAIARRANPLLDVSGGLLTLAAATTVGTVIPALLLKAGDAWAAWVLQVSTGGQFGQRLASILVLGGSAAAAVAVIFGVVAIVLSLVQAVLMLFRQVALVILAGVLPLAAAGSIAPLTRPWIRKITSWMLALICYKPAAAAVYAAAFTMTGSGRDPRTVLMGFVMLLLSVITLPALMKFFTWTTGAIAGSGGGGQLLGAAAVGAIAVGTMRSPGGAGGPAQDQATYLSTRLDTPPGGSPPPGGGPRTDGPAGPPSGQPPPQAPPPGQPGSSPSPPSQSTVPADGGAAPTGAAAGPAGTASAATTAAGAAAAQAASAAARKSYDATEQEDSR